MTLSPALRRLTLTLHVTTSVGWLGAVVGFLALSLAGVVAEDPRTVRSAYLAMASSGRFVLVPLSLASLLTGLVQSLGTRWGLFRHYWIVIKLVMNVFASLVLLLYLQTLDTLSDVATATTWTDADLGELRSPSPAIHAVGALVLLVVAVILSIYKPRGTTKYAQRRQQRDRQQNPAPSLSRV